MSAHAKEVHLIFVWYNSNSGVVQSSDGISTIHTTQVLDVPIHCMMIIGMAFMNSTARTTAPY